MLIYNVKKMCFRYARTLAIIAAFAAVMRAVGEVSDTAPESAFNVRLHLHIEAGMSASTPARLVLGSSAGQSKYLLDISPHGLLLSAQADGPAVELWRSAGGLEAGPHLLILKQRVHGLVICLDDRVLGVADTPPLTGRIQALLQPAPGLRAVEGPRVQRVAHIALQDDFARSEDETGVWEVVSGRFAVNASRNPGSSQSAFELWAEAPAGEGLALARDSHWFWDDYQVSVAAKCSGRPATLGLAFHVIDAANLHLLKWTQSMHGEGRVELIRRRHGNDEILARREMTMPRRQWLRLTVATYRTTVRCFVGSAEVAHVTDEALTGGRIGLYLDQSSGIYFDDVNAVSSGPEIMHADWQPEMPFGPSEQSWSDFSGTNFSEDNFMQQWAHPRSFWEPDREQENFYWFRNLLFNDVSFNWRRQGSGADWWPRQAVAVVLFGDREDAAAGYRLVLHKERAELIRAGRTVAECAIEFASLHTLHFSVADGGIITSKANDMPLLTWHDPVPLHKGEVGASLGLRRRDRTGWSDWRDTARVESTQRLDYGFQHAPAAWETSSGNWQSTHRWSCAPDWSFFAGRGESGPPGVAHANAVLWNLRRFKGDFDAEFVLSPMEGTPQRVHFTWPVAFNLVFNADGRNFDSGYLLQFGTYDIPTRLFRKGREVKVWDQRVIPDLRTREMEWYQRLTRVWQQIRVQRRGNRIMVDVAKHDKQAKYLGLERVFEYDDPAPPAGERLGLWTWGDNGMAVARVTISYEESPRVTNPANGEDSVQVLAMRGAENEPRQYERVVNMQAGGAFSHELITQPVDLTETGLLEFAIRLNSPLSLSLQVEIRGQSAELALAGAPKVRPFTIPLQHQHEANAAMAADQWRRMSVNLYAALRQVFPQGRLLAERICLASPYDEFAEIAGLGVNRYGANYDLAEVTWKAAPATEIAVSEKSPDLLVTLGGVDLLHNFEAGLHGWQRLGGIDGAALYRDPDAAHSGRFSLRLLNQRVGGPAGAWITKQAWNGAELPGIIFDYRLPQGVEINLLVKANGQWFEVLGSARDNTWPVLGRLADFVADGTWRRAEFALYPALCKVLRTDAVQIEALALADTWRMSTPQRLAYWIDNFQRTITVDPENGATVDLTFADGRVVAGYSFLLDDLAGSIPPEIVAGQGNRLTIEQGHRFLHIRACDAQGHWSAPVHLHLTSGQVKALPQRQESVAAATVPPPPFISYIPSDRLCRDDFDFSRNPEYPEQELSEFRIRRGAWVLPITDDGASGPGCVEIVNLNRHAFFSAYFRTSAWNPERWPRIAFDYKFEQPGCALNLSMLVNGTNVIVEWTGTNAPRNYFHKWVVGQSATAVQNGQWQHVEIDLLDMLLQKRFSNPENRPELKASEFSVWATNHAGTGYQNPEGARLRVDNFTIYSTRGRNPAFEWRVPGDAHDISGYSYVFDSHPETVPPAEIMTTLSRTEFENVPSGEYFFHVRACSGPDMKWSEAAHYRIEIAGPVDGS